MALGPVESRSGLRLLTISVAAAACAGVARAQDRPMLSLTPVNDPSVAADGPMKSAFSADPTWTVQIEPSVWYVAASGKVKLPIGSGTGPGSFTTEGDSVRLARLNLDSPSLEPAGEVHLSADRWRFSFSGATAASDRDTTADSSFRLGSVAVASGDPMHVEFSLTSVEVTVGYRVWGRVFSNPVFTQHPENAVDSLARVYVIGGGRFYDASFSIRRRGGVGGGGGAEARADEFFGEPIVGVRTEIELAQDFTIDLQLSAGGLPAGDTSVYSLDIIAGFQWRPVENVGIQIGYRQLAYELADGKDAAEFKYNGRLAGLYAGVVVRF